MFTGIIHHIATASLNESELTVVCDSFDESISIGDSVAINGVCLTVIEVGLNYLKFFVMEETFKRTNLRGATLVNLECSLKVGDRYHGHLVQGHVHDIGVITTINGSDWWIRPRSPHPSIQVKNGITVNGVNLTIADINGDQFKVCLIPYTLKETTFYTLKVHDNVNLEYVISNQIHDHNYYMDLAVLESEKGRYVAPPNPWVGALLVLNGDILGRGYHRGPGTPHAECEILHNIRDLKDTTLYVTLEPCMLFDGKRTGSCAELIVKAGVPRVVIGCLDADRRVHTKGISYLKENGVEVILLNHPGVARSLRPYFYFKKTGLPYIVAKIALSLDGCYTYTDNNMNNSRWITSEQARNHSHRLRASSQAIVVGSHTVADDNPSLTVRLIQEKDSDQNVCLKQPLRVCLGPPNTNLLSSEAPLLVIDDSIHPNGIVIKKNRYGYFDMEAVFALLGERGIMQCLVEGGSLLHSDLLAKNLVHELHIYRSNAIVGSNGKRWCDHLCSDYMNYQLETVERIDDELYTVYRLNDLSQRSRFSYIEKALTDLKAGKPVILMDDHERENEGDLVMGAQFVTAEMVTFFKKYTTGILCVPMLHSRASRLNLPLLSRFNEGGGDIHNTPFTISCDAKICKTGVSSEERAWTIQKLVDPNTDSTELSRPGHIFPLIGAWGGLFERQGHTEGSLELCKLADLEPIAMIGELTNEDGTMMRLQDCKQFAETHNLTLVLMDELIQYCTKIINHKPQRALSSCEIELADTGTWTLICYDSGNSFYPHRVLLKGNIYTGAPVQTRIHSDCFTGDTLGSLHCDCGSQLQLALRTISEKGAGLIIFPAFHEGRGIGLVSKIRAYRLMSQTNLDTYQANLHLNYKPDERTYETVLAILKDLDVTKINLLTNNPHKIEALKSLIHTTIPLFIPPNEHNRDYLQSKNDYETTHLQKKITAVNHIMKGPMINKPISIAMITTYWNEEILEPHRLDIERYLKEAVSDLTINKIVVPGSFEIPYGVRSLLDDHSKRYDAIICLGTIIKGDTAHFKYISSSVIQGLMKLQVLGTVPIINGILNTYTRDQALERLDSKSGQAESLALSAIRMIMTFKTDL